MKKEQKKRTKYRSGTAEEVEKRNTAMFKQFKKLLSTGKYTRMGVYQILADEFEFTERNSVYPIILKMEKMELC